MKRKLILFIVLLGFAICNIYADNTTYYARVKTAVSGKGKAYVRNGYDNTDGYTSVQADGQGNENTVEFSARAVADPGYTFTNWSANKDITYGSQTTASSAKIDIYAPAGTNRIETILTANFTANKYTISFDANGGTGEMSSQSATYDTDITLTQNAFTKEGYFFVGWNTKADGTGTQYYDGATVRNLTSTAGGTVTLYAYFLDVTGASMTNGKDLTGLIINPTADQAITTGWTASNIQQQTDDNNFQVISWDDNVNNGSMTQTINNVPNGIYEVTVDYWGVYTDVKLTVNGVEKTEGAGNLDARTMKIRAEVTNGTLTISAEATKTGEWWCRLDNFTLKYLGAKPDDYIENQTLTGYIVSYKDDQQVALGRGAEYNARVTTTNTDGLILNVIITNPTVRIQYGENQYLGNDLGNDREGQGPNSLWVDRNDYNTYFYIEKVGTGYKFISVSDETKALGINGGVAELVAVTNAATWEICKDKVNLAVSGIAHYGTFVAPFDVVLPANITAHQIVGKGANYVTLGDDITGTLTANTPVILNNPTNDAIIRTCYGNATGTQNENADDYLVGIYEAGEVSSGYALQYQNEECKFFKIVNPVTSVANRAYLKADASSDSKISLYFEGEETAISNIEQTEESISSIYSISGAKLDTMQKGMNIVKYADGTIKKVFVK